MSHFYGTLKGNRGTATRCGIASSGITATVASWRGAIRTTLYVDDAGNDCYRVIETPWHGAGQFRVIDEGIIGLQQQSQHDDWCATQTPIPPGAILERGPCNCTKGKR